MSSTVAVKVKALSASLSTKLNLNKLCDKLNLKVRDIKSIRDSFLIIFNNVIDCEELFNTKCLNVLNNCKFEPVLPNELKSARSILVKKLDKFLFDKELIEITSEIKKKINNITNVIKINGPSFLKITFSNIVDADKCINDGLFIFSRYFPGNQLYKDIYVKLLVCHKCFAWDKHTTRQCPSDANYTCCAKCASKEHNKTECQATAIKCINCQGPHEALSGLCPIKKQLLKDKRTTLMSETKLKFSTPTASNIFPNPSNWPPLPHSNTPARPNHLQANNISSTPTGNIAAKTIEFMCFAAKSVPPGDNIAYANKLNQLFKKHGMLVLDNEDIDFPFFLNTTEHCHCCKHVNSAHSSLHSDKSSLSETVIENHHPINSSTKSENLSINNRTLVSNPSPLPCYSPLPRNSTPQPASTIKEANSGRRAKTTLAASRPTSELQKVDPSNGDSCNDEFQPLSSLNDVPATPSMNSSKLRNQHDLINDSWNNFQVNKLSKTVIKDIDKFINAIKLKSAVIISPNKSVLGESESIAMIQQLKCIPPSFTNKRKKSELETLSRVQNSI